jgi:hypothetical protein
MDILAMAFGTYLANTIKFIKKHICKEIKLDKNQIESGLLDEVHLEWIQEQEGHLNSWWMGLKEGWLNVTNNNYTGILCLMAAHREDLGQSDLPHITHHPNQDLMAIAKQVFYMVKDNKYSNWAALFFSHRLLQCTMVIAMKHLSDSLGNIPTHNHLIMTCIRKTICQLNIKMMLWHRPNKGA